MRDDVLRFDRTLLDQIGDRRGGGGLVIDKMPHAGAFEKRYAPTVAVMIRNAGARRKAGKTEDDIGWNIAVHSEQLAHDGREKRSGYRKWWNSCYGIVLILRYKAISGRL